MSSRLSNVLQCFPSNISEAQDGSANEDLDFMETIRWFVSRERTISASMIFPFLSSNFRPSFRMQIAVETPPTAAANFRCRASVRRKIYEKRLNRRVLEIYSRYDSLELVPFRFENSLYSKLA